MPPALQLCGLSFSYEPHAAEPVLKELSLAVPAGELWVLTGPSGCGKSTLAALLAGLYPENGGCVSAGEVRCFGEPLPADRGARTRLVSMLFQNPELQFCMDTLRKELRFCMENQAVPPELMDERIRRVASSLAVERLLDCPFQTLSGGQKQLANLVCLALLDSRCLLLDEPFANLDMRSIDRLLEVLAEMKRSGKTMLVIDHRPELWEALADAVCVLEKGGRVERCMQKPEEIQAFLKARARRRLARQKEAQLWPEIQPGGESGLSDGDSGRMRVCDKMPSNGGAGLSGGAGFCLRGFSLRAGRDKDSGKSKLKARSRSKEKSQTQSQSQTQNSGQTQKSCQSQSQNKDLELESGFLLQGTDADFEAGKITAIVGPSGAGKTTLLLAMLGLQPYEGQLLLGGREISSMRRREIFSKVGIVFQNPSHQFVAQRVLDELSAGLRAWRRGVRRAEAEAEAGRMLDSSPLAGRAQSAPYMLSQGQQRRLAVMAVLAAGQRCLLLDEPTYGQDDEAAAELMGALRQKVDREGITAIVVTHDETLALGYADAVYCLKDGGLSRLPQHNIYEQEEESADASGKLESGG